MDSVDLEGLLHDLNNVFQTIGDGADMLQADPKWAKLASVLQRSVSHGKRLANSFFQSKAAAAEPLAIVARAVQFALDYLECVRGPNMTFCKRVDPEFRLPGDPAAWERVLVNLFLNAAEAGAATVSVEAEGRELVVWDDGPGISPELLPQIFQPHVSTKSIFSGLGLYVVQSLVEQHGGTVMAGNRQGGGAEFRISLGPGSADMKCF